MKDMKQNDKISILMGLYNAEKTIDESIKSIINQTYQNWELIICDDGSTDNGVDVVKEYLSKDNRIVLIRNNKNMGLNYTLNHCLKYATGEYIARMDADDVCSPMRFEKEIEVLKKESNIDFVSTGMTYFDDNGTWGRILMKEYPEKKDFLYGTPFCHAPCMIRSYAIKLVDGYTVSNKLLRVEDYHLWLKMYSNGFKGKNIQECLYSMRDDRNAFTRRKFKYRLNECYVKLLAIKKLKLPIYGYLYAIKPILVGLMPYKIYLLFHKKNLKE